MRYTAEKLLYNGVGGALLRSIVVGLFFFCQVLSAAEVDTLQSVCYQDSDCGAGKWCQSCTLGGVPLDQCIRSQTTTLPSSVSNLPFNRVAWLTTHNSFAICDEKLSTGPRVTFCNQEVNVTEQLINGVRGLMLDMYDFKDDIWLCHSFGGQCYDSTSFEPAINTLNEIQVFLAANPSEIITIFIEDYVRNGSISNLFASANLKQYWYPVENMPTNGAAWPTVSQMVANNWRLLVFTSMSEKQAKEGIAYEWGYINENWYGNKGQAAGSCSNRGESNALNDMSRTLILENYFPDNPIEAHACVDNSENLYGMLDTCYAVAGNRWANFLAVDFYKRSKGGGAFQAVEKLNAQMECGCNTIQSCEAQTQPGVCNDGAASIIFDRNATSSPTSSPAQGPAQTPSAPPLSNNGPIALLSLSLTWAAILGILSWQL